MLLLLSWIYVVTVTYTMRKEASQVLKDGAKFGVIAAPAEDLGFGLSIHVAAHSHPELQSPGT